MDITDDLRGRTLRGTFFHAPDRGAIDIVDDALVEIDAQGRIGAVIRRDDPNHAEKSREAGAAGLLTTLPPGRCVLPGFVDLHIHAPQYPQLGRALDVPLEVWLQKYTFPLEARYADTAFAQDVYGRLVSDLRSNGTTTAVYFATIHQEATRILVDACLEKRQRALVGKVAMDDPASCPEFYRDASPEVGLEGTRALIDYVRTHPENGAGLVLPVVTPRFIPSCTDPLLEGLGSLAAECGCHVQTHCSESDWAHAEVLTRYGRSDSESLDRLGLLTRRTVLAHGNFISGPDMEVIRRKGSGIAHCPLSNVYFSNAVFPLRAALEKGVRVGLGTDISGGPSASMFDTCRSAVASSRILDDGADPDKAPGSRGRTGARIDWREAFHLATAGGGDVLDLPIGRFEPGCFFDAMVIDPEAEGGNISLFGDENEDLLQKIIYTASRGNIEKVWVAGA